MPHHEFSFRDLLLSLMAWHNTNHQMHFITRCLHPPKDMIKLSNFGMMVNSTPSLQLRGVKTSWMFLCMGLCKLSFWFQVIRAHGNLESNSPYFQTMLLFFSFVHCFSYNWIHNAVSICYSMHILLTNLWGKLLYHDLHRKTLSNSHTQLAQQTY